MREKKGFTLIELLAVFVILAIISLITVPIVIGVVNSTSEKSEKRSIEGYARAVENGLSTWEMMNPKKSYSEFNLNSEYITTNTDDNVETRVTCDYSNFYNNGEFDLSCCYTSKSKKNSKYYNYINKKVVEASNCSAAYKQYNVGTPILLDNSTYYVINGDSDKDYVTAIRSTPLTAQEIIDVMKDNEYGLSVEEINISQLADAKEDDGDTIYIYNNKVQYYLSSSCNKNNELGDLNSCNESYTNSFVYKILNAWGSKKFNSELKLVDGYSVRVLSDNDLLNIEYRKVSTTKSYSVTSSDIIPILNLDYDYWTMSSVNSTDLAYYKTDGDNTLLLVLDYTYNFKYIIPIINIKKSVIN